MKTRVKARILMVDDVSANLIALEAVLHSPRYELVAAGSGAEALAHCETTEFALVVLDVQMPAMDGYETAQKIKQTILNRETPIVFVTAAYKEDPYVRRGFEAGAIDYFGKPFDPDILRAKIGIYTDLYLKTHRLRETEELLKTHTQIKTLLNALPVGVIIADASGRIYECNEEATRIWGEVKNLEPMDYNRYEAWWPENGEKLKAEDWALARALAKGDSTKDEVVEILSFDGRPRVISNSAYPIHSADGSIIGAIAVLQDLTARSEIAQDIEQKAMALLREVQLLNGATG